MVAASEAPVGLPPVARPAINQPKGDAFGFVDVDFSTFRPDPQAASRAHAAVFCAAGRDLATDPALDAAAADFWIAGIGQAPDPQRTDALAKQHQIWDSLRVNVRIPGVVASRLTNADPCVFGEVDLRSVLHPEDFDGIDAVGVAFFPDPEYPDRPYSSLQVLLLDRVRD